MVKQAVAPKGFLSLGDLPVWHGVQKQPGFQTAPYVLRVEQGLIRLDSTAVDLNPIVDRYSSEAYTFITTPPGVSGWGDRRGDWYFRELAGAVGNLREKNVLEIGAGTLYVVQRLLKELGARHVTVCDPVLKIPSPSPSIEVVSDYFKAALFSDRLIDLVVSINNLEHIPDPWTYLAEVRGLLERSGGKFFVVIPECCRGLKTGDWGICAHEHLSYFTQASFASTVTGAGFSIDWIKTQEDTLLALLSPANPIRLEPEESQEVLLSQAGAHFQKNLQWLRGQLEETLELEKNCRLGIHGCTVGLNNILAVLGICSGKNVTLFDGDSAKRGMYLPAFQEPIRHSTDPSYSDMTELLIAATTYYAEIRSDAIQKRGIRPDRIRPWLAPMGGTG